MSDTPQGADWWQASDGKWYPPSAASGQPQTQQQPQAYPGAQQQWAAPQNNKKGNKGCLIAIIVVFVVAVLIVVGGIVLVGVIGNKAGSTLTKKLDEVTTNGKNDISISYCGPSTDPDQPGAEAKLTVLNHSSASSEYGFTIDFESKDGSKQLSTAPGSVVDLGAGQSKELSVFSSDDAVTGVSDLKCEVGLATRIKATSN